MGDERYPKPRSGSTADQDEYMRNRGDDQDKAILKREAREKMQAFNRDLSKAAEEIWRHCKAGARKRVIVSGVESSVIYDCLMRAREALGSDCQDLWPDFPELCYCQTCKDERAAVRAWCAEVIWKQRYTEPFNKGAWYGESAEY